VDQVELFFDRELAICLRQVSSSRGHPIRRTELTGLSTATVDQAGFDYEPPPGKTVITRGAVGGPARGGLRVTPRGASSCTDLFLTWRRGVEVYSRGFRPNRGTRRVGE